MRLIANGRRHGKGYPRKRFLHGMSAELIKNREAEMRVHIIGYLSVLFGVDWHDRYGMTLNALVLTGILGGYTTFSSMQLDAAKLAAKRRGMLAASYLLLSVLAGLLAALLGSMLARAQG